MILPVIDTTTKTYQFKQLNLLFGTAVFITLIACGGSSLDINTDDIIPDNTIPTNIAPIAIAGTDQSVTVGTIVSLTAEGSNDADGDTLSYGWSIQEIPENSSAILTSNNGVMTEFTADTEGEYQIELTVDDGTASSTDMIAIFAAQEGNNSPSANAGLDQTVNTMVTIQLDGSASTDADGDSLTYLWSFVSMPQASTATLSNSTLVNPTFDVDLLGEYVLQLVVNDGDFESLIDSVTITYVDNNIVPIANAGTDQSVSTGNSVTFDGGASNDGNNDSLTYSWSLISVPENSVATLASTQEQSTSFITDIEGIYIAQLIVNDGHVDSPADTVTATVTDPTNSLFFDDFIGSGNISGYVTNNESSLPDIQQINGRYHANLIDNSGNITLHYNNSQGRLDAQLVTFPFEAIARNIGIGTQADSQDPPGTANTPYLFAGIQVHVVDLESRNSSHVVVGHRGGTAFTVEGKNTINGNSPVNDDGANIVPDGRADIRIVGNQDRTLTVYWQRPNLNPQSTPDDWNLYRGTGDLPSNNPAYGNEVYVGLITYAYGQTGVPFVGTCDSFEITY